MCDICIQGCLSKKQWGQTNFDLIFIIITTQKIQVQNEYLCTAII